MKLLSKPLPTKTLGSDEVSDKEIKNPLDAGSRPAARGLAGMTNYDTASQAGIKRYFSWIPACAGMTKQRIGNEQ